ncbi:MAG: [Fe-Fe] hydrogenase large subunit C-terminal domain-containing protein [Planctomycetota bacterium]
MVSIMPCTAKKTEAALPQHRGATGPDVDHVLTTQELGRMLLATGIRFADLEDEAFDLPLGFASGAGVIFGASGGVAEAALRYLGELVDGRSRQDRIAWKQVRGTAGRREAQVRLGDQEVGVAVVHGLGEARSLVEEVRGGRSDIQFIEVMACPGGCIAGAGQPISKDQDIRVRRAQGLYRADSGMPLQTAQDNHLVQHCYAEHLGPVGGTAAHELLHTGYQDRSGVFHQPLRIRDGAGVRVHVDGGCDQLGAQQLVTELEQHCDAHPAGARVSIDCTVRPGGCAGCATGSVQVGRQHCVDAEAAWAAIDQALAQE